MSYTFYQCFGRGEQNALNVDGEKGSSTTSATFKSEKMDTQVSPSVHNVIKMYKEVHKKYVICNM